MFKFFANIFGYILNFIYGFVNNYGLAIIIFTIFVKLIMLPLTINQQKTMKKSTKIQQQVKELQDKYKNDQTRLNQEVMDLYKKENMSPMGGCFTSLLQIILIISVFYLVSSPLTYMKHVEPELINQYVQEIQEKNGKVNYQEIAVIKEKAAEDDRVSINMDFFGLNLSDVPSENYSNWKVFIIPVLYVTTSFISMKVTNNLNKKNTPKEETKELIKKDDENFDMTEEMNKNMAIMMPLMTVSIALIAPLGLALYWLINNIYMLGERLILNKFLKSEEE